MQNALSFCCVVFLLAQVARCDEPESTSQEAKLRARLEQFSQQDDGDPDLADFSSKELVTRAVESSSDPGHYFASFCKELAARGEGAKEAISAYLGDPNVQVQALAALPTVAGYIDQDFQVDVAKKCLFHPKARQIDDWAIKQGTLLKLIARSPNDETDVLDRLIASGRLEAGSDLERAWRSRFVPKAQERPGRAGPRDNVPSSSGKTSTQEPPESSADGTDSGHLNWGFWSAGGMVVVALAVYFVSRRRNA